MPNYTFYNTETDEEYDLNMSMAEREQYLSENPHVQQRLNNAFSIGDPVRMGVTKPSDSFRDVLREIKSKHRGSRINTF